MLRVCKHLGVSAVSREEKSVELLRPKVAIGSVSIAKGELLKQMWHSSPKVHG